MDDFYHNGCDNNGHVDDDMKHCLKAMRVEIGRGDSYGVEES